MGGASSKPETNEAAVDSITVTANDAKSGAVEGDFSVRYGGDGLEDILKAGEAESKEALHAKMQQAYEAGMRDSSADNAAAMAKYKLSIIGDFQRELQRMQSTHATTASSLAASVQSKLQGQESVQVSRCLAEEASVTQCYVENKGDPLKCASLVQLYLKCAAQE